MHGWPCTIYVYAWDVKRSNLAVSCEGEASQGPKLRRRLIVAFNCLDRSTYYTSITLQDSLSEDGLILLLLMLLMLLIPSMLLILHTASGNMYTNQY